MTSIDFYTQLGFTVGNTFVPEGESAPAWAWLDAGQGRMMLARATAPVDRTLQAVLFYAYCPDVEAMRADLETKGIPVGAIRTDFYAPKGEFRIEDPDGYVIMMTHRD